MNNSRLLVVLLRHLTALLPLATTALLLNLALMVLALAQSPNCHLSTLATVLPIDARRDNLRERLRRWLKTPTLSWERYYRPLVRQFLAAWPGADPAQVRISFFGDAEFRAVELQRFCQEQQWQWQVGVKSDTLYQAANGVWKTLRSLPIERGERRYVQHLILTEQHAFGPVNLIIDWNEKEEAPRYWVLDQRADRYAWRRGRKRFWIEPTNRDLKSAGFDLECSALPDGARLSKLVLAMAVTWLWMVYVGHWVLRTGRLSLLAAEHKRDYSRFRLGRDWVRRALALGWPIPIGFTVGP